MAQTLQSSGLQGCSVPPCLELLVLSHRETLAGLVALWTVYRHYLQVTLRASCKAIHDADEPRGHPKQ